jgi:hypothetical protein
MRDKVEGLDIDDIVQLSGDLKSIQSGSENAANIFPSGRAEPVKMDLKDKLKSSVETMQKEKAQAEKKDTDITVKPGKQPFTYYVNDGMKECLVGIDGNNRSCNCGNVPKGGFCIHIEAAEMVAAAI